MKYYARIAGYTATRSYFEEKSAMTFVRKTAWDIAHQMEEFATRKGYEVYIIGVEAEEN